MLQTINNNQNNYNNLNFIQNEESSNSSIFNYLKNNLSYVINSNKSFFLLFCESKLIALLGRCSLSIYIFQVVIVEFYYACIVEWIETQKFPWLESDYYYSNTWSNSQNFLIVIIGVFLAVIISIYIQIKFHEQFIMPLYLTLKK